MYVKVEPTGCCERQGYVQVRFDFFLDTKDAGYSSTYIQVPERGLTKEEVDSGSEVVIPLIWQLVPFHTHFYYASPTETNKQIMDKGEAFMKQAYDLWRMGGKMDIKNVPVVAVDKTAKLTSDCLAKVELIKGLVRSV